jgi:hypothetical protein
MHKVKCAVVRLRALMARHSARLITNHPIKPTSDSECDVKEHLVPEKDGVSVDL